MTTSTLHLATLQVGPRTLLLVSAVVVLVLCPLVIYLLQRAQIVDRANNRSSHKGVVPRGAGVVFIPAILCGAWLGHVWNEPTGLALILVIIVFALLGLTDDFLSLPASLRLCSQVLIALVFVSQLTSTDTTSSPLWLLLCGAFWIVFFVNAFNFMDGINGISAVTGALASAAIASSCIAHEINAPAVIAISICGSSIAFLPYNVIRAKCFMGDVGSYFLGGALSSLTVVAITEGIPWPEVFFPLALYIGDVTTTLVRRARRGDRLFQAHREHSYQRLANELGLGHTKTTLLVAAATFSLSALGVVGKDHAFISTLAAVAIVGGYVALPDLLNSKAKTPQI